MVREIREIENLVAEPKDVVILSHRNPDGDAVGSSLALYYFLKKNHHSPKILFPSEFPQFLSWMPEVDKIWIYDIHPEECLQFLRKANLIFYLDFNSLDRIDRMGELNSELKAPKILIDHHIDPEPIADHLYWDTAVSSTSELIFEILQHLDKTSVRDKQVAEALMTGILTDTGSFHYAVKSKLMDVSATLLKADVDYEKLQNLVFNNQTEKQVRLLGHCLHNRMEILPELRTGLIWLNRSDYKTFDIQRGDTEGIVNQLLKMGNVDVAALITEQPNIVKLSFRSKGDISVQQLARDHFNGGGHKNASGGYMHTHLKEVLEKFKKVVPQYI